MKFCFATYGSNQGVCEVGKEIPVYFCSVEGIPEHVLLKVTIII